MEFVHVFEGGDEPVFVKERDLAEYRKRFPKAEEALAFDVDGKPVFVRARDVGAFKQKHGGKAEPAFGVEVDGEPVFVRERDRAAFAKKMGAAARAKAEAAPASGFDTPWQGFKEGALRGARDVGLSAAKGVASVPGAVVGVADLVTAPLQAGLSKLAYGEAQTGLIGGVVEEATELLAPGLNRVGSTLDAAHSEEFKADREKVNAAEGFKGTAAAILKNAHVAGSTVVESVAPMLLGGGIGNRLAKAAPKLAGVAGSIGEGLVAGGALQEELRSQSAGGTTTPAQSALAAGAGLATGAIGAASNRLGDLVGASDVEAVAAGVAKRGVKAATRAERALRGIAGVGLEAAEEMLQEPGEGIAENLGTGRPWDEGLKNRAVQGGVAGAVMGAGANVDLRRGPVAERVAAARREGTPDPLLEDSEAGKAARLAAMRANRPTPPPEMPPTMPQDGPAAPPPMIVEIDGKPHEVVAEDPAAQTATVVSEMGEVKQVPLSMVPPMPENVVGAPPPEAPELGEVVPDADGTGQRATLVSAPMFLPPATAPEMIALPEPVPPVLPDAPPLDVPDAPPAPPAPPPATVETPPRAETPEMPPPVAAGELPGAENVTRTKKTKAKKPKGSSKNAPEEGGARFSPAEGEGGGVETAARAPAPGVASVRRGTPQGAAGGKLNGKPRIGLRLGDVVEFAVALANGKVPRVVERIRGMGGRAAGVFKPNADGTASIDIRADQALVVGTGERAALMAETSEQVQAELGERPGVEDAEGRANWDARAREVFKEKLDEAFARNVQDDPEQAMKVMAHEVGHWVDWLPDNTLKRGNVFGHIAALKGFLFGKLGLRPDQQLTAAQIEALRGRALEEAGGDAKKARSIFARLKSKAEAGSEMARLPEVKAELEKLIAWYNNSESMPEYYSEPAEMFADAFSAWVNYPAEVAARAPIFNSLVEEWIAARPEAYAHYAAIQKKLETPGMSEGEQVRRLEEGFERSRRDAELAARARERVGGAELSDRVLAFFHRTMDPIYRRVARLKDKARAAETLKALADQRYWGADAERITTKVGERVVKPLQAAGVSITRFNTFLAMRRIANEGVNTMVDEQRKRGRANLFNPFGFTARSAGAWLKAHGEKFPESLAAMEAAAGELVAIRREVLFPILKASEAVSEKTYEMLLENWAYAKFKVNQHGELKSALERMMGVGEGGSGLKTQRGTLREIGGPLENTVLADIAMARWALTQNANWRAIQDIMATTPEDVKELRPQWVAGKPVWRDVHTPRVKTVHVTRLGVDHAFAVPTAIARALGKRGDESVVSVLAARLVQGQARLLTTWNLGFALRNPFRDYQRAARLLPGWAYLPVIGNPQLLWRVFANLPASVRRARGLSDPRVDEALKRHMLVSGHGSYSTDSWYGAEDDVSKAVRNSGLGMRAAANKGLEAGRRALDLLGVVTKALQLSETAVKLASMQYLDAKFPAMPEHIKQRMVQRYGGTPDVLERSMLGSSPAARMALLFYDINKEGLVNAVEVARERPIEQAYKAAVGAIPAIATSMAAYGAFSAMLRELAGAFDDDDEDDDEAQEAKHGLALWAEQVADWETMQKSVPFRDRMLYNATAFAWTDKEQGKVAYVRFMDDPMNGAVRAMTLGALEAAQGRVSVFDALDIGVGDQTPNLSPFASLGVALLTGKDAAFGWRNIVSDPRAINSPEGRKQNLKEYAKWTYNNISGGTLGLYRIQPDRDPAAPPPGALEEKLKTAGLGTLASSFVRVSNAGLREQFRKQDAQYEGWLYDNTKLADRWIEMQEAREDIPEEMQKRRREIPPARWEQMLTERRNERNLKSKPLDVQRRKETRNRPRDFR